MNQDELTSLICRVRTSIYQLKSEALFLSEESLKQLIISDAQHQVEKIQDTVNYLRANLALLQEEIVRRKNVVAKLEQNLSSVQEAVNNESD